MLGCKGSSEGKGLGLAGGLCVEKAKSALNINPRKWCILYGFLDQLYPLSVLVEHIPLVPTWHALSCSIYIQIESSFDVDYMHHGCCS